MLSISLDVLILGICLAEEQSSFLHSIYDDQQASYGDVIHATAVFRHGDRAVDLVLPTDPPELSYWEEGIGQLTKAGKLRAYNLGKWFRHHYSSLLADEPYRYDVMTMNCSAKDRTLMSAELFLAGMYPPSDQEMWNDENLRWQPIPVNEIPVLMDHYLRFTDDDCERYVAEKDSLNESPEILSFYAQYRDVIEYVREHSGVDKAQGVLYETFWDIWNVYDTLFVQTENNRTIQKWAQKVFPEPLLTIGTFCFVEMTYTDEMKRLRAGPLLGLIVDEVKKKAANSLSRKKFQLYSAHDTTLFVLLSILGVFDGVLPTYSSAIIFELRKRRAEYFVGVLYRNSSTTPPYILQFSGCERNYCTLEEFLQVTAPKIPEDWEEECKISFWTTLIDKVVSFGKYFVLAVALLLGASIIIVLLRLYLKRKSEGYRSI